MWAGRASITSSLFAVLLGAQLVCVTLGQVESTMRWVKAADNTALCNDRTRAGFFISRNRNNTDPRSGKWVIFLESGSLCYSNDTCNRRFFNSKTRRTYDARTPSDAPRFPPFGRFDPQLAWDNTVNNIDSPEDPETVINPLMSSMKCFNTSSQFPDGFEINGTDFFDRNDQYNKLFPAHNHVIIPYCSSDLWLGDEQEGTECDCFNFTCFDFNPSSAGLQFTFRGKKIFQSIINQLVNGHGMGMATEIVLSGSSAGGVGVVNHAQWLQRQLQPNAELFVIFDSAWFINFQDSIYRIFDGTASRTESREQRENNRRLLGILKSNEACNDTSLGFPCCISAHCMFTTVNTTGSLRYFPEDVRVFAISSIYDVFLLVPAAQQVFDESNELRRNASTQSLGTTAADVDEEGVSADFIINFLRLLGEYGGAMNTTIIDSLNQFDNLAVYLPQCMQHVYLATSTLRGEPNSVLGNDGINIDRDVLQFRHTIEQGRWNSSNLANTPTERNRTITIQGALLDWYMRIDNSNINSYQYRATCQGPYCHPGVCPDRLTLLNAGQNNWPPWSKVLIACLIMGLSVISLFMKMLFVVWLYRLERKQDAYLDILDQRRGEAEEDVLGFPRCEEEDAIAVSCLDIHYSVSFRAKKAVKDEKKDQTAPIVLNNIANTSSDSDSEPEESSRSSRLFSLSGASIRRSGRHKTTRNRASALLRRTSHFVLPETSRRKRSNADLKRHKFSKKGSVPPHLAGKSIPPVCSDSQTPEAACMHEVEVEKEVFGYRKKKILKAVSVYFNPGEMIGVMGPSGCGKTTFLDLMTGRRKTGTFQGEIYVNGIPMDEIRDWYVANTGYVLQLATPYYEELTVRENLTLAAQMKLPKTFTLKEKFERIEQVVEVTGLTKLAETVVGGATGPGLSGGQKRRLAVALQLLKMPSIIFLDEPTSGLDATGSFELLSHLNKLADSNRTVVLTIHQPRLEIFHMFDRLVLLSDGKVAYHGAPEKAYEVFVNALTARYLEQGLVIPELEDHNPADVIMDMLGNQKMRQIITDHYQMSDEPRLVKRAITAARWKEYSTSINSLDTISNTFSYALFGSKKVARRQADLFTRMATLEARGSKRGFVFFLPFMFFAFGFVLGTVYLQQLEPLYIISGVCVFSVASGLFMFPAMYPYYQRALQVYSYEKADGVGRSVDLVLQGFIRFSALSVLPAIISASILYLMLINAQAYNALAFLQVVLVNVALSQCWISLLIALICAIPNTAFRVSSGISAVAGFTSGFFIPVERLGWWWRWLVYINPNYYAVSSVAVFVLSDFQAPCPGSEFGCFLQSGTQILQQFNFDQVNPYIHLTVILFFTIFYLFLAIFANWVRHTSISSKLKRFKAILFRKSSDMLSKEFDKNPDEFARSFSMDVSLDDPSQGPEKDPAVMLTSPLPPIGEADEDDASEAMTPHTKAAINWRSMADRTLTRLEAEGGLHPQEHPVIEEQEKATGWAKVQKKVRINDDRPQRPTMIPLKSEDNEKSAYLREGDSHRVWRPKKAPQLADLVSDLLKKEKTKQSSEPSVSATTPVGPRFLALTPTAASRSNLKARQKTVFNRVLATQVLLRETTDELLKEDEDQQPKPHLSLLEASKKITANIKKQRSADEDARGDEFSSVVRSCLNKMRSGDGSMDASTPNDNSGAKGFSNGVRRRGSKKGAVPLKKWKHLARKETQAQIGKNPVYDRTISEYPLRAMPETTVTSHKALGRSTSAGTVPADDQSSFGITLVEPGSSSAHPTADSTINITITNPGDTTPPAHQLLMKKDSHGVIKPSKMAQLKGAVGRRGSAGLSRQTPIDLEASLTSSITPLIQNRDSDSSEGVEMGVASGTGKRLLLNDPPQKILGRSPSPDSLGKNVTSTML